MSMFVFLSSFNMIGASPPHIHIGNLVSSKSVKINPINAFIEPLIIALWVSYWNVSVGIFLTKGVSKFIARFDIEDNWRLKPEISCPPINSPLFDIFVTLNIVPASITIKSCSLLFKNDCFLKALHEERALSIPKLDGRLFRGTLSKIIFFEGHNLIFSGRGPTEAQVNWE